MFNRRKSATKEARTEDAKPKRPAHGTIEQWQASGEDPARIAGYGLRLLKSSFGYFAIPAALFLVLFAFWPTHVVHSDIDRQMSGVKAMMEFQQQQQREAAAKAAEAAARGETPETPAAAGGQRPGGQGQQGGGQQQQGLKLSARGHQEMIPVRLAQALFLILLQAAVLRLAFGRSPSTDPIGLRLGMDEVRVGVATLFVVGLALVPLWIGLLGALVTGGYKPLLAGDFTTFTMLFAPVYLPFQWLTKAGLSMPFVIVQGLAILSGIAVFVMAFLVGAACVAERRFPRLSDLKLSRGLRLSGLMGTLGGFILTAMIAIWPLLLGFIVFMQAMMGFGMGMQQAMQRGEPIPDIPGYVVFLIPSVGFAIFAFVLTVMVMGVQAYLYARLRGQEAMGADAESDEKRSGAIL